MNFPFRDPVEVGRLTREDLDELLRSFEDAWAEHAGERLSSAQFYDLYRSGEVDSMFATSWATYYEAFRRRSRANVDLLIVESLSDFVGAR